MIEANLRDLLTIVLSILNEVEKSNYQIIESNEEYIIIISDGIKYKINKSKKYVSFDTFNEYINPLINAYPYLDKIFQVLETMYNKRTDQVDINAHDQKLIANLVIRMAQISASFEKGSHL